MNDPMRNVHDRLFNKLCNCPIMTLIKKRKNNMMLYWVSCLNSCLQNTILYNYCEEHSIWCVCLFVLMLDIQVNNFLVMPRYLLGWTTCSSISKDKVSCSLTQHSATINTAISSLYHGLWHWIPLRFRVWSRFAIHCICLKLLKMQFLSSRTVLFLKF